MFFKHCFFIFNHRFNKNVIENIFTQIDKSKRNFLYFEWPFGSYIFDEIKKTHFENINLIKFSLFDIFELDNRDDLFIFWNKYKKQIFKELNQFVSKIHIDGFLVTYDWLPIVQDLIRIFSEHNIPTINIVHEGVFQDRKLYYAEQAPISDLTLVWGELQKQIFLERGYPEEKIKVIGSIKLNSYKDYIPKITREQFFKILNLNPNKKTILYCCQLCDNQWGNQNFALEKQRIIIDDLINIANHNGFNLIVRNAPAHPSMIIPQDFKNKYIDNINIKFEGLDIDNRNSSSYLTEPSDNIYYSDIVVGMNTTMQLEASILAKPAIVAHYFNFDPKWHKELGLPIVTNKEQLANCIINNIDKKTNLIDKTMQDNFYTEYGFNPNLEFNPINNLEDILMNI